MDGVEREYTYTEFTHTVATDTPPTWQVVANEIERIPLGTLVPHRWLRERLGYPERRDGLKDPAVELALMGEVSRVKWWLSNEHKLELISVVGEGYRTLVPKEHAAHGPLARRRAVDRALASERRTLTNVRTDELAPEERVVLTNAVAKNANLSLLLKDRRR